MPRTVLRTGQSVLLSNKEVAEIARNVHALYNNDQSAYKRLVEATSSSKAMLPTLVAWALEEHGLVRILSEGEWCEVEIEPDIIDIVRAMEGPNERPINPVR